ncbi:MAG: ABC transporter ATP-binding protein [Promethearchaeota archaeon]
MIATIGELIFGSILILFTTIIMLFSGVAFMRWYARKREWDAPRKTAMRVGLLWGVLNLLLEILFLYFLRTSIIFGPSIIFDPIIVAIEIGVITFVVQRFYNKDLRESLIFTGVTQVLIYDVGFILGQLGAAVVLMTSGGTSSQAYFSSGVMYLFCFIILLGITVFYVNWGDKIQFVKDKNLIILFSVSPGLLVMTLLFYQQLDKFISSFGPNVMWAILTSVIIATVLKLLYQNAVTFTQIRDLTILEKEKKILEVNELKVYYPLIGGMLKRQFGNVKAVDGITFDIRTGETVGLVGESGCGKTTVANAILGLVPKEAGEIIFNGEPIPNEYPKFLRRKIQIVFQDPDASLNPRMKIVDIIAEPLKNLLGITKGDEIRKRVLKLLEEVSLKREHMDRFPHEFSGGQKQRIIIARALASNPELIILDEPTSALDVSVQAQILNLLKDLQKTYGYGFLFITHNLAVVNHIADRVAVMYLGKFVEIGETDQIFSRPTHPYTIALLESRTELDPSNKEIRFVIKGEVPSPIAPPPGCTFNPRCISEARTSDCMRELPHKIKIEDGHYIWCVNPPISMQKQASVEHGRSNIIEN